MPWLMLLPVLLWKMLNHMGRCCCPYFYHLADVIAILYYSSSWYDTTLHVLALKMAGDFAKWQDGTATFFFVLRLADVIAMWQDGTATFILLKDGRCYCQVADGTATMYIVMANVIAKWQVELPLRVGYGTWWML